MVIRELFKEIDKSIDTVCCIGFFDSVHRGHKKLIKKAVSVAKEKGLKAGLITFDKDPVEVITSTKIKQANTFDKRKELFGSLGIDVLYVIHFDKDVMSLDPKDFITKLKNAISLKILICGFDFHFGYKGLGNAQMLDEDDSFETIVISEELYYRKKVSTTRIKQEISKGNLHFVNKLLGHVYSLKIKDGFIVNADKLVLPPAGIYDVMIDNKIQKMKIFDDRRVNYISENMIEVRFI